MAQLHWNREARVDGDAGFNARLRLGWSDIAVGLQLWRLWAMLAWSDIRQRYRRAIIGPFWLTISMAIMVLGMSIVYGTLFSQPLDDFLPFLAAGFLAWLFISATVTDGTQAFIQSEGLIKHGGLPLALYIFRTVWRNVLILLHNAVVIVFVFMVFQKTHFASMAMVFVGLALVIANLAWMLMILGPLCTRYRDLSPIVTNVMQLLFFVTPIVFKASGIQKIAWVYQYNPFYYLVEAIRGPLVGDGLSLALALSLTMSAVLGWIAAVLFFARVRGRIAFWL